MTIQQLEKLCDELLLNPDGDRSEILAALSDEELRTAYSDVLRQWGLELCCGAYENSTWMGGVLMIAGNEGPIKASATAFLAILVEFDRRCIRPDVPQEQA